METRNISLSGIEIPSYMKFYDFIQITFESIYKEPFVGTCQFSSNEIFTLTRESTSEIVCIVNHQTSFVKLDGDQVEKIEKSLQSQTKRAQRALK